MATSCVPSMRGRKLLIIDPVDESGEPSGEHLVAIDTTGSGPGSRVFFVRSREAAEALEDSFCPADATILGIVDHGRPRG